MKLIGVCMCEGRAEGGGGVLSKCPNKMLIQKTRPLGNISQETQRNVSF